MRKCVKCGSDGFKNGTVHHSMRVGEQVYSGEVPAEICRNCGEGYISGTDLGRWELAVTRVLVTLGPVCPEAVSFLRRASGLRSKEVAALLDVTADSVSRWEHGKRPVDRQTWLVIGALALDALEGRDDTKRRLLALRKRPAKRVTVQIAA